MPRTPTLIFNPLTGNFEYVGQNNKDLLLNDLRYLKQNGTINIITDDYTILTSDETIICNKSTALTITLPNTVVGKVFEIKNIGEGIVTVDGSGINIDEDTSLNILQWEALTIECIINNIWTVRGFYSESLVRI